MAGICPDGHRSSAEDYCDVCGLAITTTSPDAADGAGADESAAPAVQECPNCSAQNPPDALFCEACGYDYTTGTMPRPVEPLTFPLPASMSGADAPVPASMADPNRRLPSEPVMHGGHDDASGAQPEAEESENAPDEPEDQVDPADAGTGADASTEVSAGEPDAESPSDPTAAPAQQDSGLGANPAPTLDQPWVAEVWIDPDWYADQGSSDRMPSPGLPTVVVLRHTSSLIGRTSRSRGIAPEVDISADPGVSRRHAQLTTDGTRWFIEDLGSANGTFLGATAAGLPGEPLPSGTKEEIGPGAQVYLGAWTRIVIRKAADGEA